MSAGVGAGCTFRVSAENRTERARTIRQLQLQTLATGRRPNRGGLMVAQLLEIPVVVTEQYPQGLGPTVPELGAEGLRKFPKTCFSMLVPEVEQELGALPHLRSVLLCGIEAQACIMSTALDALERGLDVHVVADACSSRSQVDRLAALSRLRHSGAFITTSEGLILQLVRDAAHPRFRQIQKLIKDPAPDSGLFSLFPGQSSGFS
ncbi:isochorismatase domain-containing protein 2 isoform X1 [Chelonoidis abingdonii]|uniref:isochorismatase domain-containing protein 2 isoform X1 n=1 Tax=Chelonoidis abingdonii TaxID=106734 RepID=UPI003F4916E5